MRILAWLCTIVFAVTCAPTPGRAEWNTDLYVGAAWANLGDVDAHARTTNLTISEIDTDTGFITGLRNGYWFDSFPYLGVDFDLFYLHAHVPEQVTRGTAEFTGKFLGKPISVDAAGNASIPSATLPLFGFAPELRARWPLMVDSEFPAGRWQPYVTAGPSWAFSLEDKAVRVEFGGKVGIGVAYNFTPMWAVFSEFRYTFYPGFDLTDRHVTYTTDIDALAFLVGGSLRF